MSTTLNSLSTADSASTLDSKYAAYWAGNATAFFQSVATKYLKLLAILSFLGFNQPTKRSRNKQDGKDG